MNILLDTQIALWALTDSPRLSVKAREWIMDAGNTVFFSAASVWEIAIKHKLVRGDMPVSGAEAARLFREAGKLGGQGPQLLINLNFEHSTSNFQLRFNSTFDVQCLMFKTLKFLNVYLGAY